MPFLMKDGTTSEQGYGYLRDRRQTLEATHFSSRADVQDIRLTQAAANY
jgi:hypothetical protein